MIVKMKRAKLIFLEKELNKVLPLLQLNSIFMLDEIHYSNQNQNEHLVKTNKAITILERYLTKKGFGNNNVVDEKTFLSINQDSYNLLDEIISKDDLLTNKENERLDFSNKLNELIPYKDIKIPFNKLLNRPYVNYYIGKIKTEKEESFLGSIQSLNLSYEIISREDELTYLFIGILKEDDHKLNELMDSSGFNQDVIRNLNQRNELIIKYYEEEINKLNNEINTLNSFFKEKVNEIGRLKLLYDQLSAKELRSNIVPKKTKDTYYLEGWIREDSIKSLDKLFKQEKIPYEIDLRDPLEDELVPTALKNNKFVKPFENITNEFSVPNYKELDPNPIMSFWYWIIFGIMMGDVGYGLLMIIIFGSLSKFGKLKGTLKDLVKVFMLSGITATMAGFLFGSFLGFDLPYEPVIDIINDPIPMLIISIVIGVIHLITALIMKLILSIKQKDILTGLNDAVSWILILIGISLLALGMVLTDEGFKEILNISGMVLSGIGVLLIIVLSGRDTKSIFGKFTSAFGGLYNSTSYLSDVLSYSRILALALSSGVIAMTFNILGDLVWHSIPILGILLGLIVYIIGHVFNFVMGLLSAYVHTGRLQYLEFYGKFYEGGGYLYKPFNVDLKYLYKIELEEKESLGGK
ncbi:MAG: V-type ATP synthase subunit I [Acholeplasmataceae bacterium]